MTDRVRRASDVIRDDTGLAEPQFAVPGEVAAGADQRRHNDRILDAVAPDGDDKDTMFGIQMDCVSLVTLKWMRMAGSQMIEGVRPDTVEDIMHELAVFFLAHDVAIPVRERARLFRLPKAELEIELDSELAKLPLSRCKDMLAQLPAG